jgi:hypothetical protein
MRHDATPTPARPDLDELTANLREYADALEEAAKLAANAERDWHARIAAKGTIGDSDVYASGAANAAEEIAHTLRTLAQPDKEKAHG